MVYVKRTPEERAQAIADKTNPYHYFRILPNNEYDYGGDIFLWEGEPIPEGYTHVPVPFDGAWLLVWDGEDWIEGGAPPPPPENPEPMPPTIDDAMRLIGELQTALADANALIVSLSQQISQVDYNVALNTNAIGLNGSAIGTLTERISAVENDMVAVKGVINI